MFTSANITADQRHFVSAFDAQDGPILKFSELFGPDLVDSDADRMRRRKQQRELQARADKRFVRSFVWISIFFLKKKLIVIVRRRNESALIDGLLESEFLALEQME